MNYKSLNKEKSDEEVDMEIMHLLVLRLDKFYGHFLSRVHLIELRIN
jgi:hypothetical protein